MKNWWASKTIIGNIIMAALGIISEVSNVFPISKHPQLWVSVTAALNILLRLVTSKPIGTGSSDAK